LRVFHGILSGGLSDFIVIFGHWDNLANEFCVGGALLPGTLDIFIQLPIVKAGAKPRGHGLVFEGAVIVAQTVIS
jgi:hypothetical protein